MLSLLDTNICVYLINRRPGHERLLDRIDRRDYGELLISAITLAELEFGVAKSARGAENRGRLDLFLARFEVAPFDADAAAVYGRLRAALEGRRLRGAKLRPMKHLSDALFTQVSEHLNQIIRLKSRA